MKCYNHIELDAVATCQRCGKGLCRACASKYNPCLCDECAGFLQRDAQLMAQQEENEKRQKYIDALVDTKSEFISTCIKGIVIAVIIFSFYCFEVKSTFGDSLAFAVICFFIPFGWHFITYLQSRSSIFLIGNLLFWAFWYCAKALISLVIGIPCFIYQLIKTFAAERNLQAHQKDDRDV